ncbi:hypothetical protein [Paraburkholderia sp.]|uniref:hypothetical protein n=1 Tax=Paraburkholderia sp. TaxID=1926495 RepID=UPI0023A3192B|nr:hypothetical protein [Paraburkholderia sp.]MDE1180767.1 hypothetical protein [Paraburkholderia sp.]
MSFFQVLVGQFAIVGTTGAEDGRRPADKSRAVAFDVIDRHDNVTYLCRDQSFDSAWDFCALRFNDAQGTGLIAA